MIKNILYLTKSHVIIGGIRNRIGFAFTNIYTNKRVQIFYKSQTKTKTKVSLIQRVK